MNIADIQQIASPSPHAFVVVYDMVLYIYTPYGGPTKLETPVTVLSETLSPPALRGDLLHTRPLAWKTNKHAQPPVFIETPVQEARTEVKAQSGPQRVQTSAPNSARLDPLQRDLVRETLILTTSTSIKPRRIHKACCSLCLSCTTMSPLSFPLHSAANSLTTGDQPVCPYPTTHTLETDPGFWQVLVYGG